MYKRTDKNINEQIDSGIQVLQAGLGKVKQKALTTKKMILKTTTDAKNKTLEMGHEVKEKATDLEESFVAYIKKHPIKSIFYALLSGAILGKLVHK